MNVTLPLSVQHHLLTLPELTIWFQGNGITVYDAFLDTGSGGTLLDADIAAQIGINFTTGLTQIRQRHYPYVFSKPSKTRYRSER